MIIKIVSDIMVQRLIIVVMVWKPLEYTLKNPWEAMKFWKIFIIGGQMNQWVKNLNLLNGYLEFFQRYFIGPCKN